jgi:hypothetical protein
MTEHDHKEAFCLMWYRCDTCGHKERIWNSRDGVTPFGMGCPSCGCFDMMHCDFQLDNYAPEHKLHRGQRFWRDGTDAFANQGQAVPEKVKKEMLADLERSSETRAEFQDGWPALDIQLPV